MRVPILTLVATLAICAAAYAASEGAQARLGARELRELIVGKTVHGQNLRGMPFKQFFDSNGAFFTEFAGTLLTGTWKIGSDGTLCLTTVTGSLCATIRKSADGTYERIADGTPPAKWLKVTAGNSLVSASALGEAVSFQSVTFSAGTSSFLIPLAKEGAGVTVRGFLALPERTDPVPAVILMHGCAGISGTEIGWATTLKGMGIATFIVDSFGGRALAQTCSRNESLLNPGSALTDAYNALELLAGNPRIDRTRIAIMGFSMGGQTALRASQVRFQERFAKGSPRFAAHLAFYPGCMIRLADEERIGGAPIRIFHGTADDWTPVGPCKAYVERLRKAGKDVALIEYVDAHHGFDNPGIPLLRLPHVLNLSNCAFVEEEGRIVDAETRGSIFFSTCWSRGASGGYNADAHQKAMKDVETILGAVFGLK